ncbi:hypothetical protein SASPL_133845 [Salvia splendens]|uniref:Uncharacterized protein n=1 Tax=Salvia splendens TaxID=180675 RepID=A0A8X8X6G8_SALSN|nr:hypothetical protein SASPL_133845 [Salvia splendens]
MNLPFSAMLKSPLSLFPLMAKSTNLLLPDTKRAWNLAILMHCIRIQRVQFSGLTLFLNQKQTTEEDALKEAGVSKQNADKLKPRKFLGKDLAQMSSHELSELREKINKGMMFIKDTKVEELKKNFVPSVIYNPVPISVHCPAMEEEDVVQPEQLKNFVPTKIYNPVPISVYDPATEEDEDVDVVLPE